ncbi:MAG: transcription termination/antitermination protein NusA [Chloroflexi bacterium]|nr:transcription termination/antitermination protein NusA [Chloroflexota bacterium]
MKSEFLMAVTQLAAERNLPQEMVVEAVEAALASAYRKENATGGQSNVRVHLDPGTGEVEVFQLKTVVEEVENDLAELTIKEAKKLRKGSDPKIDDVLEFEMEPQAAGRIAAQTAKQVVIQRLREAERELIFSEFAEREGEVFTGTVQRGGAYGGVVTLDLNGRATAVLPATEQGMAERYRPGMKMKVMIVEVSRTPRGPEIIVSRTHPDLLRRLFEMEVPEIYNGIVEIRGIAREPGSRSKVAVHAKQDGVDPVGACVGLRGIRIQNIVNELQGEKIDVIQWSKDDAVFLAHALSPAQPLRVELDAEEQTATVIVPDRSLSLAIGREGQNARLAAKLTGWKVDIKSSTEVEIERMKRQIEGDVAERETAAEPATAEAAAETATAEAVAEPAAAEAPATPEAPAEAPSEDAAIMAGLEAEAEAATVEPPAEPEAAPALSAEEMLALESLDIQAPDEVEEIIVEEEAVPEADADAAVWKTPEPVGGGTAIRFAEDILGGPSRNRRTGTRRRSSRGPARGPFRGPNRGAPPGGARPPSSGGGPSGAGGRPGA